MLVNMDGDRILGPDLPLHIFEKLNIHSGGKPLVGHFSSTADSGTYGTIAIPTRLFLDMRGYNEELLPCGFQDAELLQRAVPAGGSVVKVSSSNCVGTSLPNDIGNDWKLQSKVKNANVDIKDMQGNTRVLKFGHMDSLNRQMAVEHISKYGAVKRNCCESWNPVAVEPLGPERPSWLSPAPASASSPAHLPAPVGAQVRRVLVVCFGWRNLSWLHPRVPEAMALRNVRAVLGPSHCQVQSATDAVGWRLDLLIDARPYVHESIPHVAQGHLGFHDGHIARLLARDSLGKPDALAHLVSHLRQRLREVQTPTIFLGCYCDDGTIESVCLTWFVLKILVALGYVPMDPVYLGRSTAWPRVKCQRGTEACMDCRPDCDSESRKKLVAVLGDILAQ